MVILSSFFIINALLYQLQYLAAFITPEARLPFLQALPTPFSPPLLHFLKALVMVFGLLVGCFNLV